MATTQSDANAVLGRGTEFEGKLVFEGEVRIAGKFTGEIYSKDRLQIDDTAKVRAEITRTKGEAEANAKFLVENEEALGAKRRASAFQTPGTLADMEFVKSLNPDVSIRVLHSGEGTMWTDLKGAAISVPKR